MSVRYGTVEEVVAKAKIGDVFLCRGKSWLSNAIADVAKDRRYPGYWGWSHVFMVRQVTTNGPGKQITAANVVTVESTQTGNPRNFIGVVNLSLQTHLDEYTSPSNADYGGLLVYCPLSEEVRAKAAWTAWTVTADKDVGEPYSYLQMVVADLNKKLVDWKIPILDLLAGRFAGANFHAAFCSQLWDMLGQSGGFLGKNRIPGICEPVDCWEAAIYAPEAIQLTGPALDGDYGYNTVTA
jgi:hypothetical protein